MARRLKNSAIAIPHSAEIRGISPIVVSRWLSYTEKERHPACRLLAQFPVFASPSSEKAALSSPPYEHYGRVVVTKPTPGDPFSLEALPREKYPPFGWAATMRLGFQPLTACWARPRNRSLPIPGCPIGFEHAPNRLTTSDFLP